MSGQASDFKQLIAHTMEAFEKGQDIHIHGAPSQAELQYRWNKITKEKMKSCVRDKIMEKYGNAATEEEIPRELLLGQSEWQVEYDRAGRIIQNQGKGKIYLPKSKYEEDVYLNNHKSIRIINGGYRCCKQALKNSYCTRAAGIEAAETTANFSQKTVRCGDKLAPTWGCDVADELDDLIIF